jgi:hypothetical protein
LIKPYVKNVRDHITPNDASYALPGTKNIVNFDIQKESCEGGRPGAPLPHPRPPSCRVGAVSDIHAT